MRPAIDKVLVATVAIGLLSLASPTWAQPGRDRVLGDVAISEDPSCAVILVRFNFPVRYVTHFPLESGDELRVRLRPIAVSPEDRSALLRREAAAPPPNNTFAALSEVAYEGDIEGGPYLTLLFRRPVTFRVGQGPDYRSIVVAVVGPEPSGPCPPEP